MLRRGLVSMISVGMLAWVIQAIWRCLVWQGGSGKLRAKVGAGRLNLMEQQWLIVEADASYAFNDNLGISSRYYRP